MLELIRMLLARWFPPGPKADNGESVAAIDREEAGAEIRRLVWSGFETEEGIFELVVEGYPKPEALSDMDRQWIRDDTARQFEEKRRQEETWPARTDWDRLDAAFVELRAAGIIALHDAGMTQADGFLELAEEFQMRKEVDVVSSGFVFYGSEDAETALSGDELYLTFGAFEKRAENTPIVAQQIIGILNKKGLRASWSGDVGKRMLLSPFEWQKRSPSD